MNNLLGQTNAKHGIFRFSLNDEYIGNALNEYGEFSEIEFSIMNKFIEKDDIVFDIGSNIGAFTIPFAKKVGQKGKVYAFTNKLHSQCAKYVRVLHKWFNSFTTFTKAYI